MSHQKSSPFAGFTASCLKNPFLFRNHRNKNVHTMKSNSSEVPNRPKSGRHEPCDVGGEKNRILNIVPGLMSHLRKGTTDKKDNKQTNEMGKLIEITPPTSRKRERRDSNAMDSSKKWRNIDIEGSSRKHHGVSNHRQGTRRSGRESRTNVRVSNRRKSDKRSHRLNFTAICLNVRVSGPLHSILEKLKNHGIKNVVTLCGAGISTAAGIPDFRSPDSGLYEKLRRKYNVPCAQAVFERKYFDKNPKPFFALLKETLVTEYKPTLTHYFIKLLEEKGLLLRHFTQNVDGLERLAGISHDKIVEAHGTVYTSRCMKCRTSYDIQWLRDQLIYQGKSVPHCQDPICKGIVRPNVVLFGESLDSKFTHRVRKDLPQCDLLIIMGTSLVVEPFSSAVKKVSSSAWRLVINNIPVGEHLGIVYEGSKDLSKRKKKDCWRDAFIQGSCDDGVAHLTKLFKWERDLEDLIERCEPRRVSKGSPHRSLAESSKSKSSPREMEKRRTAPRIERNTTNYKSDTSSVAEGLTEEKQPRQEVLTELCSEQTPKNWWRSIVSKVRNLTSHSQER